LNMATEYAELNK
jgi:Ran GTPase-activating protein (RanGAP) involved in mRNA processing and transport